MIVSSFEASDLFSYFRFVCLVEFGLDLIVAWFRIFKLQNDFRLKFVGSRRLVAAAFRSLLRLIVFRHRERMNVIDPFNTSYFDQNVLCQKDCIVVE